MANTFHLDTFHKRWRYDCFLCKNYWFYFLLFYLLAILLFYFIFCFCILSISFIAVLFHYELSLFILFYYELLLYYLILFLITTVLFDFIMNYISGIRAVVLHDDEQKDVCLELKIPGSDENSILATIEEKESTIDEGRSRGLYLCASSVLRSHSIWETQGIWEAALDQGKQLCYGNLHY